MLAVIRPDEWNFPLLLHVLGAMVLVGSLLLVSTALLVGWRGGNPTRLGFWGLYLGVLPSFVLMRIAGEWTESREFGDVEDAPGWIDVGYVTSDLGAVLLLICLVLAGIGLWRGGRLIGPIVAVATTLLLLAYVVAVWAMTTKPD